MARSRARFWIRLLAGAVTLSLVAAAGAIAFVYVTFLSDLPDLQTLDDYRPQLTSTVYDRKGRPVGEFFEHRRTLVDLERLPRHVIDAFIAAEDDTFYEHRGVDYVSIARAAWANFRAGGETVQGASTITQQMVKQLLLSPERTYRRKIRELFLARRIEQNFDKEEILYLYLNQIYFGSGAYGVGEAARTYYGKRVEDLDLSESAMLAGLPKAPGRNSPFLDPERADERRRYVLARMLEEGLVDEASWREADSHFPELGGPPEQEDFAAAAYFTEEVRKLLVERLGNELLLSGGLRIETTLDLELQYAAKTALRSGLEALDRRQGYRGHLREVGTEGITAELEKLAEENALAPDEALPHDRVLVGVVESVDRSAGEVRVGFAPDREGVIRYADLKWARPFDLERYPYPVRSVASVFDPGDVARFRVVPPDDSEAEAGGEEAAGPPRLNIAQEPDAQGAVLSLDISTGEVLAMVGGYDFEDSEFNRATQAERQPGSAFKPLVYAAALGKGYTPASILYDRPVVYDDPSSGTTWRPQNYGRKFLGALTMRESLARSVNNATIHLMKDVGVGYVIDFAQRVGITAELEPNLSLALGSNPVSLVELTRAYAVFPNGGRPVDTTFILRVLDRDGTELLGPLALTDGGGAAELDANGEAPDVAAGAEPGEAERDAEPVVAAEGVVTDPGLAATGSGDDEEAEVPWGADGRLIPRTQAFLATDLLRGVVVHPKGTGGRARSLGKPVAGKTGTTNAQGDAWFMGFSPEVATGVWVGFDSKQVLGKGETGGRAALPIWIEFMESALAERPASDFAAPEGIVFARVDPKTGLLAAPGAEDGYFQAFEQGTEPVASAEAVRGDSERRRLQRLDF